MPLAVVLGVLIQRGAGAVIAGAVAAGGLGLWAAQAEPSLLVSAVLLLRPVIDVAAGTDFLTVASLQRAESTQTLNATSFLGFGVIVLCPLQVLNATRWRLTMTPLRVPLPLAIYTALIAWAAVTVLFAEQTIISLADLLRIVSIWCVAVLTWRACRATGGLQAIWRAMVLSAVIPSLTAVQQFLSGTGGLADASGEAEVNRALGTVSHPNPFGHYLVLTLLATWGLIAVEKRWRRRVPWLALALPQAIALFATFTRGAWVAGVVAAMVLLYFSGVKRAALWLIAGAIIIAILYALGGEAVQTRLGSLESSDPNQNTALGRLLIWEDIASFLFQGYRPITGVGIGSVSVVADRILEVPVISHNDYLRVLLELGVIGLVMWIGLFAASAVGMIERIAATRRDPTARAAAIVGLAALAAYFTGGWVENLFTNTLFQWCWWPLILAPLVMPSAGAAPPATGRTP
jgi:O-antigen ligase